MILRDCTANTDRMIANEEISSRKWDILAMKMSEDYDGKYCHGIACSSRLTKCK